MAIDIYQQVTDQIISALESGALPWVKSWSDTASPSLGIPFNYASKKPYNGINTLLLWVAQNAGQYPVDCWLTYKQAQAAGGNVRKGEKGTHIVFYKPMEKKTNAAGETERGAYLLAKGYTVFNVSQCDGIELPAVSERPSPDTFGSLMNDVARTIGADLRIQGNRACFIPSADQVHMPHPEQFTSVAHYDAVLAHELTHWTGHKSRLDRDLSGRFGNESYAAEELIAELGAAYLSAEQGFCINEMRHPAYIASWLKVLKDDKRAIFTAASQAQKAVNFIKQSALAAEDETGEAMAA